MDEESDPKLALGHPLDPAIVGVIAAAERRGTPWRRIVPGSGVVQLGLGRARRLIHDSLTALASAVGVAAAADSTSALALLAAAGVPVQPGGRSRCRLLVVGSVLVASPSMDGSADEATQLVCLGGARLLGLDVAAVEVDAQGAITAVEAAPKLGPDDSGLGDAIVANAFPGHGTGRVPIVSVTGSSGKTTVVRLVGHIIGTRGWSVGVASSDDVCIGDRQIFARDGSDRGGALAVLVDAATDAATDAAVLAGRSQSRLRLLCSRQDRDQVVPIPAAALAAQGEAFLLTGDSPEHIESNVANHREIFGGVTGSSSAEVLAKAHVENPVEPIFNAPVRANEVEDVRCGRRLVTRRLEGVTEAAKSLGYSLVRLPQPTECTPTG